MNAELVLPAWLGNAEGGCEVRPKEDQQKQGLGSVGRLCPLVIRDHVSTALEAKVIKPAETDEMQWQAVLPWAWCDYNMVTLLFFRLEAW